MAKWLCSAGAYVETGKVMRSSFPLRLLSPSLHRTSLKQHCFVMKRKK
jgi:hypothetical protein